MKIRKKLQNFLHGTPQQYVPAALREKAKQSRKSKEWINRNKKRNISFNIFISARTSNIELADELTFKRKLRVTLFRPSEDLNKEIDDFGEDFTPLDFDAEDVADDVAEDGAAQTGEKENSGDETTQQCSFLSNFFHKNLTNEDVAKGGDHVKFLLNQARRVPSSK